MPKKTKWFFILIAIIIPFMVTFVYHNTQENKIQYYQGHRYFVKGDFKRATPFFIKSLQYNPNYILPKKELAYSYLWTEAPAKSIPLFLDILNKNPNNNEIKLSLADAYAWTDDYAQAVTLITEVINETNSLAAKIKLAEVYLWSGEAIKAKPILEDILQVSSEDPQVRLQLGKALYYTGDSKKASSIFEELVKEETTKEEATELLAETYLASGRHEEAMAIYNQIINKEGGQLNLKARTNLGDLLGWGKSYNESIIQYKAVLKADPDNIEVLKKLADIYKWKGDFSDAEEVYQQALSKYPQDEELYLLLGEILLWQKKYDEAIFYVLKAVNSTQKEKAGILYGQVLLYSGDYAKAQEIFESILEVDPDNIKVWVYLADTYAYNREYAKAIKLYKSALAQSKEDLKIKAKLADALSWAKQYKEADDLYNEILIETYDPQIHRQKARVLGWARKYNEAIDEYKLLVKLNYENEAYKIEYLAKVTYWNKRPKTAIKEYQKLIKLEPENTEAMFDLSQIYAYQSMWSDSLNEYDEILKIYPNSLRAKKAKEKIELIANRINLKKAFRHYKANSSSRDTDINKYQSLNKLTIPLNYSNNLLIDYTFTRRNFSDSSHIIEHEPRFTFEHLNSPEWHFSGYYGFVDYEDEIDEMFHLFGCNFDHSIKDFGYYNFSYDRERIENNKDVLNKHLYRNSFNNRALLNVSRNLDSGFDYLLARYSDSNMLNQPGVDLTYTLSFAPKRLLVRYRYYYMQFNDKVSDYWSPKGLSNNSLTINWRHFLNREEIFFGADNLYYDLKYNLGVDSESIVSHKFNVELNWDINKRLNLNVQGSVTNTSCNVYNDKRLAASVKYYF